MLCDFACVQSEDCLKTSFDWRKGQTKQTTLLCRCHGEIALMMSEKA